MALHPHLEATHDHLSNAVKSLLRAVNDDKTLDPDKAKELLKLLVQSVDCLTQLAATMPTKRPRKAPH